MGGGASKNYKEGKKGKQQNDAADTENSALVLAGPIVGKVSDSSVVILLEVDITTKITMILSDPDGQVTAADREFPARQARSIRINGLTPDTKYTYKFEGLARSQLEELTEIKCQFRTMPESGKVRTMRIVVQSCDRPRRLLEGEENPWDRLDKLCSEGMEDRSTCGCDIMLHLGDQVYTKMDGFLDRAKMKMDNYDRPCAVASVKQKMLADARENLREAYRYTWNQHSCKSTLAQSSHLMIWSDNDVANDFTEKEKPDGTQYYTDQFIQAAMGVYTEYQRQLWDPDCEGKLPEDKMGLMEEWHFHKYGPLGIFMIDMRGNRITAGGIMKKGALMSSKQKAALEKAFNDSEITCMLVASEIPFVSDSPANVKESAKKIKFLEGHWAYCEEECTWLFDLCCNWKAAAPDRRDVVLLGGDIHTGVESVLEDRTNSIQIKSITASPITNHVCGFFNPEEGEFSERYAFKHRHLGTQSRNFCKITANFTEDGACNLDVQMETIPTNPDAKHD
mmetsp:Transcript_76928/g.152302  ORF Transcript_76928/g.152302 Transcript_76928/m.152302 type:complete len:508 (-) Transcript_76928:10-1533(-)